MRAVPERAVSTPAASADGAVVELRHVSKRFGGGAVGALDVSLALPAGHMVALFGPSGSGKTTILHMIGLLLAPDEGEVWLEGKRVDHLSERASASVRREAVGFVFQSFGLVPLLTAEENVMVALRLLGQGGEKARVRVQRALETVDLAARAGHRPAEMSGGEQQRVALARAIINHPSLILADEPTGNLDSVNSQMVLSMLRDLNLRFNQSIVMITHNSEAASYAHRIVEMRDGKILSKPRPEFPSEHENIFSY
jgi:putative ABC transport system ATP-binding protein